MLTIVALALSSFSPCSISFDDKSSAGWLRTLKRRLAVRFSQASLPQRKLPTAPTCRPFAICITSRALFQVLIMLLLFDVPLAPIYFGAVFLIHPALGFISLVSGLVLITIALVNQKATSDLLDKYEFAYGQGGRPGGSVVAQFSSYQRHGNAE